MASPQKENGYTPIANETMEALGRTLISGEARQMLDVIIRKTYGFNKNKDKISTSQFMELTGLSRLGVYRSRKKLLQRNMITVYKNVDSQVLTYSLQKDYDKWILSTKKKTVYKNVDRVSTKMIQNCLHLSRPQKKERQYTKDNIYISEVATLRSHYYTTYKQVFKVDYVANHGKDGKIFKDLVAVIPLEELKTLINLFFESQDEFIKKAGYTTGVFQSQVNKLRNKNNPKAEVKYL